MFSTRLTICIYIALNLFHQVIESHVETRLHERFALTFLREPNYLAPEGFARYCLHPVCVCVCVPGQYSSILFLGY